MKTETTPTTKKSEVHLATGWIFLVLSVMMFFAIAMNTNDVLMAAAGMAPLVFLGAIFLIGGHIIEQLETINKNLKDLSELQKTKPVMKQGIAPKSVPSSAAK